MNDEMFQVPPELVADNAGKQNSATALTNEDVTTVIQTLIDRVNDIYMVTLALERFSVKDRQIILSSDQLNPNTTLRYLGLINKLTGALHEKISVIEEYILNKREIVNS